MAKGETKTTELKVKIDQHVKDGQAELDRLLSEQSELYFERRKQLTQEYEAMVVEMKALS